MLRIAVATLLLITFAAPPTFAKGAAHAKPSSFELKGAYSSIDALVDEFLLGVEAKDWKRIDALRVTEQEYRRIIIPGSAGKGKPLRQFDDKTSRYYWQLLDTKSRYSLTDLLGRWGGQTLKRTSVAFRKGLKEYAGYVAHEKLSITATDPSGAEVEVVTGSIVEIHGRFKFVSFMGG